jgi:hypothetical protein
LQSRDLIGTEFVTTADLRCSAYHKDARERADGTLHRVRERGIIDDNTEPER